PGRCAERRPHRSRPRLEGGPGRARARPAAPRGPQGRAGDAMTALQASGLRKSFRGRRVVDDVSFSVSPGEVVGLLGPNGAGKTTSFHCVVGLLTPDGGEVRLGDRDLSGLPLHQRARLGIGYLPQEPSIFRKLTVRENFLLVLEGSGLSKKAQQDRADELLNEFDL